MVSASLTGFEFVDEGQTCCSRGGLLVSTGQIPMKMLDFVGEVLGFETLSCWESINSIEWVEMTI